MRISRAKLARFQINQTQHLVDASVGFVGRPFFQTRNQADILFDRVMRKESELLHNISNASAKRDHVPATGTNSLDHHFAGGFAMKAIDQLQGRSFSSAAAAEQNHYFAAADLQIDVGENPAAVGEAI